MRSSCTSGTSPRTVNFLPRHLHELQPKNRSDQQDPAWRRLYGCRSGIEGTVNEIVNGHRMRRCRCRCHGLAKTHVQHILTAIAINAERLSEQSAEPSPTVPAPRPRSSATSKSEDCPDRCGGAKANDQDCQDPRQSRSV
ncbi:transposase [Streptomyces sp. YIM 121038]|uniref:transposase n=1 Tax=Streptomyces sp. YIM 121038 TaxID=2136401 RepID=UPI002016E05A|nr:transposase [Streptomyces sp. YIM 121038]